MSSNINPIEKPPSRLTPQAGTLWWAYAIAPAVAPVLFAAAVFMVGMTALTLNPDREGTPAGVVLVPIISLTVGVVASYVVAGVIGMPIAFFLRKRQILNGYTIHGAAFLCTLLLIGLPSVVSYAMASPTRPPLMEFLRTILTVFVVIAPFILLSATTFWWIVSRDKRRLSLRSIFLIITGVAVLTAILVAFFR